MANTIRIKRRWTGAVGGPATMKSGEIAYNGMDDVLYIGYGDDGSGNATSVKVVAGFGASMMLTTDQTVAGIKTFSSSPLAPTPTGGDSSTKVATTAFVAAAVTSGSVADGDKGDITVSGSGAVWTVDAGTITNAKAATMAVNTLKGRITAGTGAPEDLTAAQVKTILSLSNVDNTSDANKPVSTAQATANTADRDRANHTNTQLAATISDFSSAVAATASVTANTAKVTNATHTGDVTGATALTIATGIVSNAKLATVAANTIKGNNTGSTAAPVDLTVAQTKTLLALNNVDNTSDAGKPVSTATQTALNLKIDSSLIGAANGVAALDSGSKIPATYLPALAITDTFVIGSQAAMLALTAEVGDVAIRTDLNKTFILQTSPASTLGNWQEVLAPTAAVSSVFSRTGAVVATSGDYTVAQVTGAAPLASPTFTGTPAAPTASTADNTTQIATTAYVQANLALSALKANNLSDLANAGTARANLGLGTMATQAASSVAITGGTIDGVTLDGGTY